MATTQLVEMTKSYGQNDNYEAGRNGDYSAGRKTSD